MPKSKSQEDVTFWFEQLESLNKRYEYLMNMKNSGLELESEDKSLDERIGEVIDAMNNIHKQYMRAKNRAI